MIFEKTDDGGGILSDNTGKGIHLRPEQVKQFQGKNGTKRKRYFSREILPALRKKHKKNKDDKPEVEKIGEKWDQEVSEDEWGSIDFDPKDDPDNGAIMGKDEDE